MNKFEQQKEDYGMFEMEIDLMVHEDLPKLLKSSQNYCNVKVDLSLENIDKIESYYIDVLNDYEKASVSGKRLDRILIAFMGEALIKNAGRGHWDFCEKEGLFYGLPIITGYTDHEDAIPFSPVIFRQGIKRDVDKGEGCKGSLRKSIVFLSNPQAEFDRIFGK
jgi:hypothetical protein